VSGSDIAWNEQLEELREAGARVYEGHEAKQMVQNGAPLPDAVVVSSAVVAGNEEIQEGCMAGQDDRRLQTACCCWLSRYTFLQLNFSYGICSALVLCDIFSTFCS
jgi:hypothetical protein